MVRRQIQLTDRQDAELRRRARDSGKSISAVVREAVDHLVEEPDMQERWRRALNARTFRSRDRKTDVSERHDEYYAEAIEARWRSS